VGFDPAEARDEGGRWTSGTTAGGAKLAERAKDVAATGRVSGHTGTAEVAAALPPGWRVADRDAMATNLAVNSGAPTKEAFQRIKQTILDSPDIFVQGSYASPGDAINPPGPRSISIRVDPAQVSARRIGQLAGRVQALADTYPPADGQSVNVVVTRAFTDTGVDGMTTLGQGKIRLNAELYAQGSSLGAKKPPWAMSVGSTVDAGDYVLAHEWGHAVTDPAAKAKLSRLRTANTDALSEYGRTKREEAFAEAFAEYVLTGGATTNTAAQAYAKAFKWPQPRGR
jgi:hypothetical protein